MSEEDTNLSQTMNKMKIRQRTKAKPKGVKPYRDDNLPIKLNPFAKHCFKSKIVTSTSSIFGPSCVCRRNRVYKKSLAYRKHKSTSTRKKILREPLMILPEKCVHEKNIVVSTPQDFRSIIEACEQLSLSTESLQSFPNQNFRDANQSVLPRQNENRELSTCSQQAMARFNVNPPCDVTIDELACYFETFVHIPKKMSSMAEMMYI